jgi:hypothetical protein
VKTIIRVGIFFFLAEASAQTVADSLMQLVQTRNDSTAIRAGFELNKYYINKMSQPDSVLFYTPNLIEKSIKIGDRFGETKGHVWIGNAYFYKRQYEEAIAAYKNGLVSAIRYQQLLIEADLHYRIGACYNNKNKQPQAIIHLIQAAKTFERLNDLPGQAQAYYAISLAYKHQKQPERRLEYSSKAAAIAEQLPISEGVKKAIIFASTAICLIELKPNDTAALATAKRYADLGMKICKEPGMGSYAIQYYIVYSGCFYAKKQFQQSIDAALKGLNSGIKMTEDERFNLFYRLAEGFREDKELKRAYAYIDSAKQLTVATEPINASNLAQSSYRLNKMSGASEAALKALEDYQKLQDSILNVEKTKALNEIVEKYESELKDEQILRLEQEQLANNLWLRSIMATAVIVILLLVIVLIYYQNRVTRNRLKWVEAEQRLNRVRMNPHFFFNALSTLQGIALKAENHQQTAIQIGKFAKLMRQTLEATYTEFVTLETEIEFLKQYLDVYASGDDRKFCYTIDVDDSLLDFKIPVMILQPFLENAIEHGISKAEELGMIALTFTGTKQGIEILINDNGKGIIDDNVVKTHLSRATQIIRDRLTLLSNTNAGFNIKSNNTGTAVIIHLPELK